MTNTLQQVRELIDKKIEHYTNKIENQDSSELNWESDLDRNIGKKFSLQELRQEIESLPIDLIEEIDKMIGAMIEKAEEHKENKRLDLARNTLDIVYAFRELKKRLSLTQK